MSICIYTGQNKNGLKLTEAICNQTNGAPIEIIFHIKDLMKRLKQSNYHEMIMICVVSNENEMIQLKKLSFYLEIVRLIIVLPEECPRLLNIGYSLFPRYIGCLNALGDIAKIVTKIYSKTLMLIPDKEERFSLNVPY